MRGEETDCPGGNDQMGTQRGTGRQRRSERRLGWQLVPDACPASRWMERKRSCLQNLSRSLNLSLRKPSEWPWSPRGPAPVIASLLDPEPPEVILCPQPHPDQAGAQKEPQKEPKVSSFASKPSCGLFSLLGALSSMLISVFLLLPIWAHMPPSPGSLP